MNFHVLTLFPDMIMQGLNTSILGRSMEAGRITLEAVNIRDYTINKHKKVDDYPYGGGAGMLMQAQPVYDAYLAVEDSIPKKSSGKTRVIYLTPQGKTFDQGMAKEFAKEEDLIFLCGHYEGIDERVLEEIVTDFVSIGDYVLTGGELPAMVMIDAIARMVPGVLGNQDSGENESFSNNLLEYPQYSRPEVWQGKKVPEVLLSGDHKKIEEWRLEQSLERTRQLRPELYEKWAGENQEYFVRKEKREERRRKKLLKQLKKQTAVNPNGGVGEGSASEEDT
ncbi:MAG: tRNA (guanosine(37)-N1)-methyltransferase TrmD [Lachnospiraceae bacterium]|nr:tRNA (guanosine(37)-N1)-methyltransferase TrmD [Lachnospiraceae bacterium]